MFAIPGIIGLLAFIYVRPQEFISGLDRIPFLYIFLGLAIAGLVVDLRLRITKPVATPQLLWVVLFLVWSIIILALVSPGRVFMLQFVNSAVVFVLFFVLAQGLQSFKAFSVVASIVLLFSMLVTVIGIHQGYAQTGCVVLDPAERDSGEPDGRSCKIPLDCHGPDAEPGREYSCENIGLFGTTSIMGRVRYRGVLKDPNDLALTISAGMALLFGLAGARRRKGTGLGVVAGCVLILICVMMTQSRGGLLVFLTVLGVYFVKKYRWRGIMLGALLAMPLMMSGSRSSSEASQSSMERYEAWAAGLEMFRSHPITGVGKGAFDDYHYLTAHNAYVLAPAELGIVGMVIFSVIIFLSVKTTLQGVRELADVPGAQAARAWGMALLAAMAGIMVGITFLSFTYHYVLWIYLGLCGAYYSAVKSHRPDWKVTLSLKEFVAIVAVDILFLIAVAVVVHRKGF